MTDEEKAEEYVKELILKHNRDVVLRPKNAVTHKSRRINAQYAVFI